jgi:hypothetical protein
VNLHGYVSNNALNLVDYLGLQGCIYPEADDVPPHSAPLRDLLSNPDFRVAAGVLGLIGSYVSIAKGGLLAGSGVGAPGGAALMAYGFTMHGLAVNNIVQGLSGNAFLDEQTEKQKAEVTAEDSA